MLFPERLDDKNPSSASSSVTTESVKTSPITSPEEHSSIDTFEPDSDDSTVTGEHDPLKAIQEQRDEIYPKPYICQTILGNRWLVVLIALVKIAVSCCNSARALYDGLR